MYETSQCLSCSVGKILSLRQKLTSIKDSVSDVLCCAGFNPSCLCALSCCAYSFGHPAGAGGSQRQTNTTMSSAVYLLPAQVTGLFGGSKDASSAKLDSFKGG
jgi:hypothetical protein